MAGAINLANVVIGSGVSRPQKETEFSCGEPNGNSLQKRGGAVKSPQILKATLAASKKL